MKPLVRLTSAALAAVAAVALLVAGCGGGSDTEISTPTADYLPLTVGNEWHYTVTDYSTAAAQHSRSLRLPGLRPSGVNATQTTAEEVINVSQTVSSGGRTWYEITLGWVGDGSVETRYLRHDAQGLLWKETLTSAGYYRLKAPVAVGTTWIDQFDPRYSYEITSVSDTVSTGAGDFADCVAVQETFHESGSPDLVTTVWFAVGVGLVQEIQYSGSDLVYESVLASYQLASAPASQ